MADPKGPEWQWPDPQDRPWWQDAGGKPPASPGRAPGVPGPSRPRAGRGSRLGRSRVPALALAGVTGLVGLGVGTGLGPDVANAATSTASALTGRATAIKDALAGLVKDGTLTQGQADKVASTLDKTLPKGPGRFGHGGPRGIFGGLGHEAAAKAIGITPQQLRTELQGGKTLAQVAQAHGVSRSALIAALVKAEKADLAAAVKAGRLTQAQVDAITPQLQQRIAKRVDHLGGPLVGPGRGWGRHGHDGAGPGGGAGTTPTPTPSPTATS